MRHLTESIVPSSRGLKYLTCPECAGIDFRSPEDTVPFQPFKLYLDETRQVMKHLGENALFTGGDHVFVCRGCEKAREAAHRPGRELKLIAYDAKTLAQCEVQAPTA